MADYTDIGNIDSEVKGFKGVVTLLKERLPSFKAGSGKDALILVSGIDGGDAESKRVTKQIMDQSALTRKAFYDRNKALAVLNPQGFISNRLESEVKANKEIANQLSASIAAWRKELPELHVQQKANELLNHLWRDKYGDLELQYPIESYTSAAGGLSVTNKAKNPITAQTAAEHKGKRKVKVRGRRHKR